MALRVNVSLMKNVLSDEYDLLVVGDVENVHQLHQIDAAFKQLGYEAKMHAAVDAGEFARLARHTEALLLRADAAARLNEQDNLRGDTERSFTQRDAQREEERYGPR